LTSGNAHDRAARHDETVRSKAPGLGVFPHAKRRRIEQYLSQAGPHAVRPLRSRQEVLSMNTMMLALLQRRLRDAESTLRQRLLALDSANASVKEAAVARELSQVFRALDAVQSGHYGYCDECDAALEPDQLLLRPYCLLCPECEALGGESQRSLMRRRAGAATN
jgi:RNA polymerase-binding transcription factor DksA